MDETTAFILELQHINEQQDEDEEETPHHKNHQEMPTFTTFHSE